MNYPKQIGYYSAILSIVFAGGYDIAQLLSWSKVIPYPQDQYWLFLPSLFLAPAFLVTIISLHYTADAQLRIWTAIAVSFSIVYCTFATFTYFVQLTVVTPLLVAGKIRDDHLLVFTHGSFMFGVDCLGYFFMSLSSLFAAVAFRRVNKRLFVWLLINGLLIIIFIIAYFNPFFYYIGSVWAITFIAAMVMTAQLFRRVNVPAD